MSQKISSINKNFVVYVLFVINLFVTISLSSFDSFLPLYLTNIGLTGIMFGVTVSSYAVVKMLFAPVLNAKTRKAPKKNVLLICILLLLSVCIIFNFSSSLIMLIIARSIQGASVALFRPVLLYILKGHLHEERKASMLGAFDISFYAGIGVGPFLGGIIHDHYGFEGILFLLMVLCLISSVILWRHVPSDELSGDRGVKITHNAGIFTNNKLVSLFIFIFGRGYLIATSCYFLQLLLTQEHGMTTSEAGLVMTCSSLAMILFLRLSGRLADIFPAIYLISAGGMIVSFLYCMVPLVSDLKSFIILFIVIGLFSIISQPAATLTMINETSDENLCVATSYANSFMGLGVTFAILFGSLIMKSLGFNAVFMTAACISWVTVILSSMVYHISFEMITLSFNPDRDH